MKVIDLAEARRAKRRAVLDMGLIRIGDISVSCVVRNIPTREPRSKSDRRAGSRINSNSSSFQSKKSMPAMLYGARTVALACRFAN